MRFSSPGVRRDGWPARRAGLWGQIIDINLGCPAGQVIYGDAGSALMRDPDHASRLIDAVVSSV
jgi:tRNA-dihydrouridine synthase B